MSSGRKISEILGLPKKISPLIEFLLSSDEIDAIFALYNHSESDDEIKDATGSALEEHIANFDILLQKGLIHKTNGEIELITGIDSLWALLLSAGETHIPSAEFDSATGFLRSFYSKTIKEHPHQYWLFPLREAFLPKYGSAENQDNILKILENAKSIIQRSCRCRETFQNCLRPTDTCLVINDPKADNGERQRVKPIDLKRAKEILRSSLRNGNVLILYREDLDDPNARMELHSCCSCCSVLLGAIKDSAIGQIIHVPNLLAEVNPSKCNGCAT
ncbi:MAG: hypothetical protein ACFFB3_16795, partial [Candidatus Hodarchaeota archaeon]